MVVFDFRGSDSVPRALILDSSASSGETSIIAIPLEPGPALSQRVNAAIDAAIARWRALDSDRRRGLTHDDQVADSLIDADVAVIPPDHGVAALALIEIWQRRFGFRPWVAWIQSGRQLVMIDLDAAATEW